MKFYRSIGNALLSIIIVGLIFYNGVMEDRPDVSQTYESSLPILFYFIKVQGICFVNIVNVIMTGIFSVSLVFPT